MLIQLQLYIAAYIGLTHCRETTEMPLALKILRAVLPFPAHAEYKIPYKYNSDKDGTDEQ